MSVADRWMKLSVVARNIHYKDMTMYQKEDYLFFYRAGEPHGYASQWYPSKFTASLKWGDEPAPRSVTFQSAEQWMMVQKALLFNDLSIAAQTLEVEGTGSGSMAQVKALGRKVKNFNDDTWKANRERIVLEGNLHKFRQNPDIKEKLLGTGEKILVEASPPDRIWGIGVSADQAMAKKDQWGLNLLGKALVKTRTMLREEEAQKAQVQSTDTQ